MLGQRLDRAGAEGGVVELAARGGDDRQVGGKQPLGVEPVERGQQHAVRQVAGRAEQQQMRDFVDDHRASLTARAMRRRLANYQRPGRLLHISVPVDIGPAALVARRGEADLGHRPAGRYRHRSPGLPLERLILQSVARPSSWTRTATNTAPAARPGADRLGRIVARASAWSPSITAARLGIAAAAAAAAAAARAAAARARAGPARAGAGADDVRRAARRRGAGRGRLAGDHRRRRGKLDARLGRDDRGRLALDILGRGRALVLLGLGLFAARRCFRPPAAVAAAAAAGR